jgi:hypothetical protein
MFPTSPQLLEAMLLLLIVRELRSRLVVHEPEPRRCAAVRPARRPRARPPLVTVKSLWSERAAR